MVIKKILNFMLKPLFDFGIFPKLASTGYLYDVNVFIGEKERNNETKEYVRIMFL